MPTFRCPQCGRTFLRNAACPRCQVAVVPDLQGAASPAPTPLLENARPPSALQDRSTWQGGGIERQWPPHAEGAVIPKKIHIIWFGNIISGVYLARCMLWKQKNASYEVSLWVNNKAQYLNTPERRVILGAGIRLRQLNFPQNVSPLLTAPNANYGAASDVARLWLLYNHGGMYFDTDTIPGDAFPAAVRAPNGILFGSAVGSESLSSEQRSGFYFLSNDILASTAKNPFMLHACAVAQRKLGEAGCMLRIKAPETRVDTTLVATGPKLVRSVRLNIEGDTLESIGTAALRDGNGSAAYRKLAAYVFPQCYAYRTQANDWIRGGQHPRLMDVKLPVTGSTDRVELTAIIRAQQEMVAAVETAPSGGKMRSHHQGGLRPIAEDGDVKEDFKDDGGDDAENIDLDPSKMAASKGMADWDSDAENDD